VGAIPFCLAALKTASSFGQPEIWNSDQGAQFTADFLAPLKQRGIAISMDGRGRALDNVFIERFFVQTMGSTSRLTGEQLSGTFTTSAHNYTAGHGGSLPRSV